MSDSNTPLLDELEKGPWPSFVTQIKQAAKNKASAKDLLGQLELSYKDKKTHWKHGGIVGVRGYGGGVIGRYSDVPDKFPNVAAFHTVRVNQPSGWFYNTKALRQLCDIWDKYGSGMTNLHGSTGDIVFLGTTTEALQPIFDTLSNEAGFDLGGSGSDLRTPSCCNGQARCEYACYDTMALCYDLTMTYQSELHRPPWPYKFKLKFSGCPNDCVASIARSDMSFIGTWKDEIQIDQAAVKEYADKGMDIQEDVINLCPTKCMKFKDNKIFVNSKECNHCMHCINIMPKALRPGKDKGVTILIGAKAPIVQGAQLASVLIPFWKPVPPYKDLKDLLAKIWDFWDENGKIRERVGELILRVGLGNFLEAIGLEPSPQMISQPRDNPFIYAEEYFEEE
ncbi:dissimilatory-type sulfite reductase subunit alpha [Chloroflexota bacterium]